MMQGAMIRPRLFFQIWSVEARKLMSYRTDFWLTTLVTFGVELTVAYSLWRAIFTESGRAEIGGFGFRGMVGYYLLVLLLGKLVRGDARQVAMAQDIYEGHLTRYLLYPSPYFGFKYAEHLGSLVPAAAQLVLAGLAALAWLAVTGSTIEGLGGIDGATLARTLVAVALANLLAFLMIYLVQAVAFWADNVWSLNVMLRFATGLLGGLALPLSLFPDWARSVLALLPFQYLYYQPVMTLLGRVDAGGWARGLAIAAVWCLLLAAAARNVWSRGYRTYTGVGI